VTCTYDAEQAFQTWSTKVRLSRGDCCWYRYAGQKSHNNLHLLIQTYAYTLCSSILPQMYTDVNFAEKITTLFN
jgi:hypothetical protein